MEDFTIVFAFKFFSIKHQSKYCNSIKLPTALTLYMYMKIAEYKKIEVDREDITDELFLLFDYEITENLNLSNHGGVSNLSEIPEMCKKLEKPALTCLLKPRTPAEPKIFRSYTKTNLQTFQGNPIQLRKTKWGIKVGKVTI